MATIGVIAGRFDIAKEFVERLTGDIPLKEFNHRIATTRHRYEVYLKNGDVYRAMQASDKLRGMRFDKLYIHKMIVNVEFLSNIMPLLCLDIEYFTLE